MQKLPDFPKKTTIITAIIWSVVLLLFVLQKFIFSQADINDTLVSVMVLLAIYLGVPTLLLCLIDWLTWIGGFLGITWLSQAIRYVVIMGFVYLVGDFVSFMIERRVPDLGIKMVLFVHLIFGVWLVYLFAIRKFSELIFKALAKQEIILPKWLAVLLVIVIMWVVYQGVYFLLDRFLVIEWLFKFDFAPMIGFDNLSHQ